MFVPPDQWLADRMRKMTTSLATKSVDKPVSTPAAHGRARARAAMGAGAEALDDSCAAVALPLCERGGKNVAGSMGCAADARDVHKLDHKKCGQALRRSGGRRRGIRRAASDRTRAVPGRGAWIGIGCRLSDLFDKSVTDQRVERCAPRMSTSLPTKIGENDRDLRARSAWCDARGPIRRRESIGAFGAVRRVRYACGRRLTHS